MNKEKLKGIIKTVLQFILNPRLLLCLGLGWIITNGWSYVLFALGTYFGIGWMVAVGGGYMAFLWFPFTPEKIVTVIIAIALLKFFFPNDQKTLAILKNMYEKAKAAVKNRKNITEEKKKKRKKRIIIVLSVLAGLIIMATVVIAWGNKALVTTKINVTSVDIPQSFDGFRIVQISDLHNAEFGKNNHRLIEDIKEADPDIIVMTGDIIDANRTDIEIALDFSQKMVQIAPTYFVTGNHEAGIGDDYFSMKIHLEEFGVKILDQSHDIIEINGEKICIAGINDLGFFVTGKYDEQDLINFTDALSEVLDKTEDCYTVLLSHRSDLFEQYVEAGVDLVFTGHAHGGQIRIPFVGGVYSPGQGMFPEYDSGIYKKDNTQMIVSRGLGNSRFPFRVNNRPEIILAVLNSES